MYLLTWFWFVATSFSPQRLRLFYSRKSQLCKSQSGNSFEITVWKFFIFLTSQTCHLEKLDELFLYTSKHPYSSSFFFFFSENYLQVVRLSQGPVCYFTFCAHLNFGKHFSIDLQCNIKLQNQNAVNEIAGRSCLFLLHLWVHLFFLFFHLPLLASLVKQQLFNLILMKYSPFVRSPVLDNLVYFALFYNCYGKSSFFSPLCSRVMCWQLPRMKAMEQQYIFSVEKWFKFSVRWSEDVQFFISLHGWESFTFDFISLDLAKLFLLCLVSLKLPSS